MTIINIKNPVQDHNWSVEQSRNLYRIRDWSEGYFDINDSGHVIAQPCGKTSSSIDLYRLIDTLNDKGLSLPVLLRFTDILKDRVNALCHAFANAKNQYGYQASYTAVYPIKVNQQRNVIEKIIQSSDSAGLEAGSKPELLSIIALANKNSTVICNGYKDSEYIKLALIGQQLGLNVIIVIEKLSELKLITEISSALQIKPNLGIRVRLSSVAAGNWQNTGGEKSKFGLHTAQVIIAIEQLQSVGFLDCLSLLHFHIGSQVSNLKHFQRALREGARFYAELRKMNVPIDSVNVGGGLGVDYEGTQSTNYCSVDYTPQDYANIVINAFNDICQEHNLLQPEILSESGRAMTAHHAMLITNVIDIEQAPGMQNDKTVNSDDPRILQYLWNILQLTNEDNIKQSYLDASDYFENAKEMFAHGLLDLKHRARVEEMYYSICRRIKTLLTDDQYEIEKELNEKLADKYFCNFSLFQSMPDAWAINQIFPIMPLHRLDESPTQRAIIKDITCDSDGRIDLYIDGHGIETTLPLHNSNLDEPYIIGIFLLGAYQEILGDMHNLFGDTASINIEVSADGNINLTELQQGDTVSDLLNYVHMGATNFKTIFQQKIAATQLSSAEQEEYLNLLVQGLSGYTYLEE